MSQLGRGAGDVARGFQYLNRHPRLWLWVIAPALVTLVLVVAMIAGVVHLVDPLVSWMTSWMPGFLEAIFSTLLTVVVVVALGAGALLVFVAVVGIIAGPFNELLSEAVEERLTGKPGAGFSLRAFVRGFVVGAIHGIRRLAIALASFALLLVLGFVPVIGTVAALALGFYFAARAAAYDSYDAVLARRGLSYRDKVAYLATNRGRTLGLGAAVAGLLLVPGLNLVALGLGAAGATLAHAGAAIQSSSAATKPSRFASASDARLASSAPHTGSRPSPRS